MNRETIARAWRTWRAKCRLVAPTRRVRKGSLYSSLLLFRDLDANHAGRQKLAPYDGLAAHWHAFSKSTQPLFAPYLRHLADAADAPLDNVLDLACGAGTLTERLAGVAPTIVGLDRSPAMLHLARDRCAALPGVSFVEADFRDFALDRTFDAVVCASNSINYVGDEQGLRSLLRCVGTHLRPGGLFVFDALTERGMRAINGIFEHAISNDGSRFVLHYKYDRRTRVGASEALLEEGVETHVQIPIDRLNVVQAAEGSGLVIADSFGDPWIPLPTSFFMTCFFVLVRQ